MIKRTSIILLACIGWIFDLVDAKHLLLERDETQVMYVDPEMSLQIGDINDGGYNVRLTTDESNNVQFNKLTMYTSDNGILSLDDMYLRFKLKSDDVVTFTKQDDQENVLVSYDKPSVLKQLYQSPIVNVVLSNSENNPVHRIYTYQPRHPEYFMQFNPPRKAFKDIDQPKIKKKDPKKSG